MPIPAIDNLTPNSSKEEVLAAISECIGIEIKSGREQDQASAMCHSMARKAVGKSKYPFLRQR